MPLLQGISPDLEDRHRHHPRRRSGERGKITPNLSSRRARPVTEILDR
jgi:hypothetical protein